MAGAFLIGAVAGLSVALPLGAVAVLLLREGIEFGRRVAAAAALGIATADAVFAALAVVVGPSVARVLADNQRQVSLLAAGVLAVVAIAGLLTTLRRSASDAQSEAVAEVKGGDLPVRSAGRAYFRFLAITVANPLTVLYFAVVATGVSVRVSGPAQGTAFVLGVAVGSGCWQLCLALAGGTLGARISPAARRWTSVTGYALVLGLAIALVVGS